MRKKQGQLMTSREKLTIFVNRHVKIDLSTPLSSILGSNQSFFGNPPILSGDSRGEILLKGMIGAKEQRLFG